MRGRPLAPLAGLALLAISIHAPMRGRPVLKKLLKYAPLFQSTPPCGGDWEAPWAMATPWYFNPRPHAGATVMLPGGSSDFLFQSTPPCGGDVIPTYRVSQFFNFNPRPHAGATSVSPLTVTSFPFQSTPPCGGDFCPPQLY